MRKEERTAAYPDEETNDGITPRIAGPPCVATLAFPAPRFQTEEQWRKSVLWRYRRSPPLDTNLVNQVRVGWNFSEPATKVLPRRNARFSTRFLWGGQGVASAIS